MTTDKKFTITIEGPPKSGRSTLAHMLGLTLSMVARAEFEPVQLKMPDGKVRTIEGLNARSVVSVDYHDVVLAHLEGDERCKKQIDEQLQVPAYEMRKGLTFDIRTKLSEREALAELVKEVEGLLTYESVRKTNEQKLVRMRALLHECERTLHGDEP